jgi:predicted ATP-grasp superfamily ATP-dependent carboligase
MTYLLIPDSLTRKGFDICSILIDRFKEFKFLIGYKRPRVSSKLYTQVLYHRKAVLLRDNYYEFERDLIKISSDVGGDKIIFIPTEEIYVELFLRFVKSNGNRNFIYQLPDLDLYNLIRNKRELNLLCNKNGVGSPKCYDVDDLANLTDKDFPLLLKPCIGSGSRGLIRLYKRNDLTPTVYQQMEGESYHIQELIENGKDVKGAFFLYFNGKFVNAYTHERIRTSPKEGGVTVLSKYSYNQDIIRTGKSLLDRVKWNGLIMLEFLYDKKTNTYKIIEANPRLWGSIMLSEYSNTNLLTDYVNLCAGNHTSYSDAPSKDLFIRWFFPVDLLGYVRERGQIDGFWTFKDTCYINWSYANKFSSIIFNFCALFNPHNLMRFFRK